MPRKQMSRLLKRHFAFKLPLESHSGSDIVHLMLNLAGSYASQWRRLGPIAPKSRFFCVEGWLEDTVPDGISELISMPL
jgi:hypothetical protein